MYDARTIAKVFRFQQDASIAYEDFIADKSNAIASVNLLRMTIEMRNGDLLHFISMRSEHDKMKVMGMQFNSIECKFDVEPEVQQYLRSRLRSPHGDVDPDIIITGE